MKEPEKGCILFEEELPGGWNWSHNLKRGTALRITDLEGGANVSALLYNARNYTERYNMADTLKAQYISFLTKGNVCYSDMGRVLLSVIGDSCGRHDCIGGPSALAELRERYGRRTYGERRNGYIRGGLESLLAEIAKYGMGPRDLHSCINFFSRIAVDREGGMSFVSGNSKAGDSVDLQAEMETLVVLNSCPHPLDPAEDYAPKRVLLTVWDSRIPAEENPCRTSCEQNGRGFTRTQRYHL